ncbi:Outer membrane efflux protein [Elusimicrobium minutum Pei191]|uniref:Outer membrane efflux protein n=1 Tax=Elusimicrobium minutum (strain Pei191) TaxID=445932 RepID=B2KAZ0_ELUMP|nr:TolC family protein [Elusimicrobium minutum]ACC97686.1 Outer membrane efflux protein [Elusimicrobium minutum Pei191]
MKKALLIVTIICSSMSSYTSEYSKLFVSTNTEGRTITIEEAVAEALNRNISVKNAMITRDIYNSQVTQFRSYMLPKVSVSGTYTRNLEKPAFIVSGQKMEVGENNTFTGGVDAEWVLWSGGRVRSNVKSAKINADIGEYNLRSVKDQIEKTVIEMCYSIILSSAVTKVQQGQLDIATQNLHEMKLKYQKGLSSNLDLLAQEVSVANIKPLVIAAKNDFELGNLYLRQLLNMDPEEDLTLTWNIWDVRIPEVKKLEELYDLAAEYRSDLIISRLRVKTAQQQVKSARSEHFPQLAAFANKYYNAQTENGFPQHSNDYYWTSSVGLRISMSIFEGFRINSAVKQKQLGLEQAEADYEDLQKSVRIAIKAAWLRLGEAKERMLTVERVIEQSQQNVESMKKRYRAGLASRLELDDSVVALTNAQLQYAQAVYDGFTALADLKFTVGYEVRK